jgi:hypothetical protein
VTLPDWAGYLRFRDAFAAVLDPALYTIDWLDREILEGKAELWVGREAAIVARIRDYPTGARDIEGLIAAGDLGEIVAALIPEAEAFGRALGCTGAIIESREGWGRVLRRRGYAPYQTALRKRL